MYVNQDWRMRPMSNKHTVKRNRRLRAKAGQPRRLSPFAQHMLKHIEETRTELKRLAFRGRK